MKFPALEKSDGWSGGRPTSLRRTVEKKSGGRSGAPSAGLRRAVARNVTTFPKSHHTLKSEIRATFDARMKFPALEKSGGRSKKNDRMKFGEERKQIGVLSEFLGESVSSRPFRQVIIR